MFLSGNIKQGITLFELLVTLTIVVILTIAAVPVFLNLYREYHLTTTILNLYYVLHYARSAAIQNNQTVYVVFNLSDNWCYGVNANATCTCSIANNCNLGTYKASRLQDLTLSATGLTNNGFTFEGTHGATNQTVTVTYTLYGQTMAISIKISPLGNAQICSSTISGYPACT